ncbi:hypothetical protein [Mesorhizobium sp.]|uniref:hypothetical protein n=1 Tax=Mesorhizobium sp. TaxID=1871066 RepID=UPI000FE92052|nr:hypothetical protein [Mesorhizobium sp.]RWB65667.1 MAG: hypothetical protein EOQ49_31430 [Mesorhizobium sp.]
MTTAVVVTVPEDASYRARVINYDLTGGAWVEADTVHVEPGKSNTRYVWDTRCLTVLEVGLGDAPEVNGGE